METIRINGKAYTVLDMPTHEYDGPPPDPDKGQYVRGPQIPDAPDRQNKSLAGRHGAVVVELPALELVCTVEEIDRNGLHFADCVCAGSGILTVKEPKDTEALDTRDDGMASLEEAIALQEAALAEQVDPILGASVGELMTRKVDKRTSSGSGKSRKNPMKKLITPQRSEMDGRPEQPSRKGRPPTHGVSRPARVRHTVEPITANIMQAEGVELPVILAEIVQEHPDAAAIIAEFAREKAS